MVAAFAPQAEGYLRTVPTASLLRHFAQHSPLLAPGKRRLGAVFGVDNLAGGMTTPGDGGVVGMTKARGSSDTVDGWFRTPAI